MFKRRFKNFLGLGRDAYRAPQIADVPEGQSSELSGTFINEDKRQIIIRICDGGNPIDLPVALGTLEIAKDIVKQTLSVWHAKDARRKSIITPNGNGR